MPKLHLVREHRLHGIVTGLDQVQTMATSEDGLDRLLVSFKDAKVCSMIRKMAEMFNNSLDCSHGMVRRSLRLGHCVYTYL